MALFIHMRGKHDVGLEDFHEVFTNAAVTGTPDTIKAAPWRFCRAQTAKTLRLT